MPEILHAHVPSKHPTLQQGDWFFDVGHWCLCASLSQAAGGLWVVSLHLIPHWQSNDQGQRTFPTKDEGIGFIAEFFRKSVRSVSPDDFPRIEDL